MYPDVQASNATMAARKAEYQGNQLAGAGQAIKQPPMQEHAQKLHDMASGLAESNARLANLLERMSGPTPEAPTPTGGAVQPGPSGVLYVAAFGAERIALESDKLRGLISRLENFI